jgi:hypothetical protein
VVDAQWGHGLIEGAPAPIVETRPTRVVISAPASSLPVGDEMQLTATAYYQDSSTRDVTRLGRWTSSPTAVATVSRAGKVSGIDEGDAVIRFSYGTASDQAEITIGEDEGESIMLAARYTVTPDDVTAGGDDFTVPLDSAEDDADYGAFAEVAEGDSTITCQVPISGRTTTQVNVLATAPLEAGDIIEVFIARAS